LVCGEKPILSQEKSLKIKQLLRVSPKQCQKKIKVVRIFRILDRGISLSAFTTLVCCNCQMPVPKLIQKF
jgi:hypothetical protein